MRYEQKRQRFRTVKVGSVPMSGLIAFRSRSGDTVLGVISGREGRFFKVQTKSCSYLFGDADKVVFLGVVLDVCDYIKREDAIQEAKAWSMFGKDDLVSRLERLPSADVMPVRHGCWIEQQPKYNLYKCSACEKVCFAELLGDQVVLYDYCPNCGARMDGGNNE